LYCGIAAVNVNRVGFTDCIAVLLQLMWTVWGSQTVAQTVLSKVWRQINQQNAQLILRLIYY
jgi:hypothetical protein